MGIIKRVAACLIIISSLTGGTGMANSLSQDQEDEDKWDISMTQPNARSGHWADSLFEWAKVQNIIDGYPDTSLKPDRPISEAEFLKTLYRSLGMPLPTIPLWVTSKYDWDYDWTDGPYRMAELYNHPTLGALNHKQRSEPITRLRAGEIISAACGVHYEGEDAVVYLIGNNMANSDAMTPEQFHGQDTFSRAEAIQWIRKLSFTGMMELKTRPESFTDRSHLPPLPSSTVEIIPDFSTEPVTKSDFDLFGTSLFPGVKLGDSKKTIDDLYGASEDKDIFNKNIYHLFSAHYNRKGLIDAWTINLRTIEPSKTNPFLRTNKGIVLGESTLIDVLRQYGTIGFDGDYLATYYYEKADDGNYHAISKYADELNNPDNVYTLSFIFDRENLTVWYISVAWYPYLNFGWDDV